MSSSTNIVPRPHNVGCIVGIAAVVFCLAVVPSNAQAISLRPPSNAIAGTSVSIATTGSGTATFYLIGPAGSVKRSIDLGKDIPIASNDIQSAGRYLAIACASNCASSEFFVIAAKPVSLTLLVHPSRAPVAQHDVISGVALSFDEFHNIVMTPGAVDFQLAANGSAPVEHSVESKGGVAWFRMNSGKAAGPLQVTASINGVSTRRVVQQVASDPCNLRIKGQRTTKGISVETDPIRDCAGNPVPDGTVVTFTARDGDQISTVDAPVKKDIARAEIEAKGPVVISAASGVVMGNELRMAGQE
ncbi:MAG: hypothetical protein WAM79_17030 [Candidatus Sulfotelmatobacter sp.]